MKRQLTTLLLAAAWSAWAAPPTEASVERLLTLTRAEAVRLRGAEAAALGHQRCWPP